MRNIVHTWRKFHLKSLNKLQFCFETLNAYLFNFVTTRRKILSILFTFRLLLLQLQFDMTYFLQASYNHMNFYEVHASQFEHSISSSHALQVLPHLEQYLIPPSSVVAQMIVSSLYSIIVAYLHVNNLRWEDIYFLMSCTLPTLTFKILVTSLCPYPL